MKQKVLISQIEVFALFIATISGLLIYLSRIGLDNDFLLIFKSVGFSYLITLFPCFFIKFFSKEEINLYFTKPFISFCVLLLLIFSGYLKIITGFNISYVYYIFGYYLFFYYLFSNLFKSKIKKQTLIFVTITLFFSFFITSAYYSNHYTHPLMFEKIINGSWAHRDILYHASIAGIFKTYFYAGTGLDGFVPHYYHSLSHYTFGILSELLKINTLTFYSIVFPIIFTPIFFMFFIFALVESSKYFSKINEFKPIEENNIFLWVLIFIFFSLPINQYTLPERYTYLASNSYSFSLTLLFLIIYLFFTYINRQQFINRISYKEISPYIFAVVILLLSICASFSKISFAYILTIFAMFMFFRFKLYKYFVYNFSFIIWIIFLIFIYFSLVIYFDGKDLRSPMTGNIENFRYKNEILYTYSSISFIILKLFSLKALTFKRLKYCFKNKKIIDIEILSIFIIALSIVNYNYFKGIQLYISYILIIAHLDLLKNFLFKKDIYENL